VTKQNIYILGYCLLILSEHCIHAIWLCFWSSNMNNQRNCQLGDYGEEPRQWLWFTKTH